jgi:hypothetical protein
MPVAELADHFTHHVIGESIVCLANASEPTAYRTEGHKETGWPFIQRSHQRSSAINLCGYGPGNHFQTLGRQLAGMFNSRSMNDSLDRAVDPLNFGNDFLKT